MTKDWTPQPRVQEDVINPWPAQALAATLGAPAPGPGDPLPPGWHWSYFLEAAAPDQIGVDGHPRRGDFLPPIDHLPRRMYAGGRLRWFTPLRIGAAATRTSEVTRVDEKAGRTGPLVFVTVRHTIASGDDTCIEETQNLVYRGAPEPGAPAPAPKPVPAEAQWSRVVRPDPVMLFRYSAVTFNGHRIHYDAPYVREVEGYPDLIVHGPLMATLLLETLRHEAGMACPGTFTFRALRPMFANTPIRAEGHATETGAELWIRGPDGGLAMHGESRAPAT